MADLIVRNPVISRFITSLSVAVTCFSVACGGPSSSPAPPGQSAPVAPPPAVVATDKWAGKWNGPEGTFVEIAGANGTYQVIISNLDGPRTFKGAADGNRVTFERDGISESLRAGSGAETGMKWLSEKTDCLIVKPGEGYCRK
jgi:hypothetical protein